MHAGSTRYPTPVLVLGLGNDVLSDDGVGLHIARRVAALVDVEPAIVVRESTEAGPALFDEIVGCENVLLIDAIVTGGVPPGFLHELQPDAFASRHTTMPHFGDITETLTLGESLGLPMPHNVRIFAVEVSAGSDFGTMLSPKVDAAVDAIAERVVTCARACLARERAFAGAPE